MEKSVIIDWAERVGGLKKATQLIKAKLECSKSKAEKLAAGRYPSLPTPLEQRALASLMKCKRSDLFPVVEAVEEEAS